MSGTKFAMQTRLIRVYHPVYKDILLFEAVVKIVNLNKKLVKSIKKIEIKYELKEDSLN
jgi:hypothetical protein